MLDAGILFILFTLLQSQRTFPQDQCASMPLHPQPVSSKAPHSRRPPSAGPASLTSFLQLLTQSCSQSPPHPWIHASSPQSGPPLC